MREFKGVEGWVRRHFVIYKVIRKSAPFLCRFITLEDGFDFLQSIQPKSSKFSVLDIGANDGTSIRMIQQYMPDSQIIAFDPVTKPTFDISDIDFRDFALGSKPGGFDIHTPTVKGYRLTQYSSFDRIKLVNQITHDLGVPANEVLIESKFVKIIDLDSLDLCPHFMKIDVEGFELEVLEGASSTIAKFEPVILIEIQSEATFGAISEFLGELGYFSIFANPRKNLNFQDFKKNKCETYDPNFNNYIWVSGSGSPSWGFKA